MHISEGWWACASISKVCLIQAAPRMKDGGRSCRNGPGHLSDASVLFFFFFKADGFRETCLSFNMACLLLIWALKPCDRASARPSRGNLLRC